MLAKQKTFPVPAPDQAARTPEIPVPAGFPPRETPLAVAKRWAFGIAYALQPQRIASLPHLMLWTTLDLLRGGTLVPAQARTWPRPDTFAGVVRQLTPETYLAAVRLGFYPWSHCGPLKWWTRQKRMVLFLPERRIDKRVKRLLASGKYRVTFDTAFDQVLIACSRPRTYNWHSLTWLTPRMMHFFSTLHRQGHAHSFEVWNASGELVGGGFGVAVGRIFVGDSMFSRETDTSKLGAAVLYAHLEQWGFALVDARDHTSVLAKTGYREIPRAEYEEILRDHAHATGRPGLWSTDDAVQDPNH